MGWTWGTGQLLRCFALLIMMTLDLYRVPPAPSPGTVHPLLRDKVILSYLFLGLQIMCFAAGHRGQREMSSGRLQRVRALWLCFSVGNAGHQATTAVPHAVSLPSSLGSAAAPTTHCCRSVLGISLLLPAAWSASHTWMSSSLFSPPQFVPTHPPLDVSMCGFPR